MLFTIGTRTDQEIITYVGCLLPDFKTRNKLHNGKKMYFVLASFHPSNNIAYDIAGELVLLVRVGNTVNAYEDSFKSVLTSSYNQKH